MKLKKNNLFTLQGGFGWIVLASVTWSYGLIISAMTNYNLIYPNLINLFNETNNKVLYSGMSIFCYLRGHISA